MPHDDSWKDDYDNWKLASPDDGYDEPCDHEDYEVDIVDYRCRCDRCGESWSATSEQVLLQIDHMSGYAEYEEQENRRQWWSNLLYNFRHPLQAIHWEFRKRGWFKRPVVTDDDIPF